MTTKTLLSSALLLALSTCLVTGCGGGGSVRPEVAADAPPPSPPPPPPPPPPAEACPMPITADCVVEPQSTDDSNVTMTGGRQSDHALIVRGGAYLSLFSEPNTYGPPVIDYGFGNGTIIEDGTLSVNSSASLHSDVVVQTAGGLYLNGDLTGSVTNHGGMSLASTVFGDVVNDGTLTPGYALGEDMLVRIEGNFTQTAAGTLDALIPTDASFGTVTGGFLSVTGRADIGGTLRLFRGSDWDAGDFPLPGAPVSMQVLHADGGVFGQFAQWTSPYLLITGAPRYLSNDVYFDITAISAAQAMAAAPAVKVDALTLHSAANFDAALGNAAGWTRARHDTFTATQRQFLSSVGAIQRLQDYAQATRTFDSLSGSGYAAATDAMLQQAATPAPELMARVGNLHRGFASGSWATQTAMLVSGGGAFNGERAGFDQWLGDRLVLGSSFGWSDGSLRFDHAGGTARDRSPQWDVYLRHNGNGNAYVFGDVGYSRHDLNLNRQIDLGIWRQAAGARRNFDVMRAYVETGRDFRMGRSRVTPFGAVSYAALHGAGFTEQGSTGFELTAQPSMQQRLNAVAGVRLGTDWRSNSGRWTSLNLTAGYRRLLHSSDDARAAFTGAPDATFALAGISPQRNTGWLQMNLATGGARWNWLLSYDRQASDEALSLGTTFRF